MSWQVYIVVKLTTLETNSGSLYIQGHAYNEKLFSFILEIYFLFHWKKNRNWIKNIIKKKKKENNRQTNKIIKIIQLRQNNCSFFSSYFYTYMKIKLIEQKIMYIHRNLFNSYLTIFFFQVFPSKLSQFIFLVT